MPDLENHWFTERLVYLGQSLSKDKVWRRKASNTFPSLKSDPNAEDQHKLRGEAPLIHECRKALRNLPWSSDLSWPRKERYRELLVGSASDPLMDRISWLMEEVCSHWNWASDLEFLNNSEFSLAWWLARNMLPLFSLIYKAGLVDMSDCPCCGSGLEEMTEYDFYNCK